MGENLTPLDVVKFTAAFGSWIKRHSTVENMKIVVGRDARLSGPQVYALVEGTLRSLGLNVVNIGLATTPTTEIAVQKEHACGGIIITASHNPKQWNALKLLNAKGEFLSGEDGKEVLLMAEKDDYSFVEVDKLGKVEVKNYAPEHINDVVQLDLVNDAKIKKANISLGSFLFQKRQPQKVLLFQIGMTDFFR